MKGRKLAVIAALLCCAAGGAPLAHKGASGIAKERMDMMKEMADAMKAIAPMMKGEADYDATAVQAFASGLANHAGHIKESFPQGSDGHPSEASPRIWKEPERFDASADALRGYALQLEKQAGNGEQAAKLLFGKIAGACKECHESFRVEKQ